jgi:hypothetical protein
MAPRSWDAAILSVFEYVKISTGTPVTLVRA